LRESKLLFPIIIGWSDKNGHRMALQSLWLLSERLPHLSWSYKWKKAPA
jgi:hypothetical protein